MIAAVTDAHLRAAVAGIRALGRAGIEVLAVGPRATSAGLRSRHAAHRATAPDPQQDPAGHVRALAELADRHGGLIVYPASEAGLEPLLERASAIPALQLPFGRPAAAATLRDKAALPALADQAGIATPAVLAAGDAEAIRTARPELPLVVKPATTPAGIGTAQIAHDRAELDEILGRLSANDRVVAQERVAGTPVSVALVVDGDGAIVAGFQERVLRTWPAEAGSFALTESEPLDTDLAERAAALLHSAGYRGLAQLDLMLGAEGPVLLDVNTRLYACLPTALRAGVNLPAAWHAQETGGPQASARAYASGVRFRWLEGELSAAAAGKLGRLATMPRRPTAGAMWAADDPVPAVLLAVHAVRVRAARRVPGR